MKDGKIAYEQPESELLTMMYESNILSGENDVTVTNPYEGGDGEDNW